MKLSTQVFRALRLLAMNFPPPLPQGKRLMNYYTDESDSSSPDTESSDSCTGVAMLACVARVVKAGRSQTVSPVSLFQ